VFRWNSYYDAMKCILENIDKIKDVCNDLQLTSISGPREISFLQEYCNVNFIYKYAYLIFSIIYSKICLIYCLLGHETYS